MPMSGSYIVVYGGLMLDLLFDTFIYCRLGRNGLLELQRHPWFFGVPWNNLRELRAPFIPQNSAEIKAVLPQLLTAPVGTPKFNQLVKFVASNFDDFSSKIELSFPTKQEEKAASLGVIDSSGTPSPTYPSSPALSPLNSETGGKKFFDEGYPMDAPQLEDQPSSESKIFSPPNEFGLSLEIPQGNQSKNAFDGFTFKRKTVSRCIFFLFLIGIVVIHPFCLSFLLQDVFRIALTDLFKDSSHSPRSPVGFRSNIGDISSACGDGNNASTVVSPSNSSMLTTIAENGSDSNKLPNKFEGVKCLKSVSVQAAESKSCTPSTSCPVDTRNSNNGDILHSSQSILESENLFELGSSSNSTHPVSEKRSNPFVSTKDSTVSSCQTYANVPSPHEYVARSSLSSSSPHSSSFSGTSSTSSYSSYPSSIPSSIPSTPSNTPWLACNTGSLKRLLCGLDPDAHSMINDPSSDMFDSHSTSSAPPSQMGKSYSAYMSSQASHNYYFYHSSNISHPHSSSFSSFCTQTDESLFSPSAVHSTPSESLLLKRKLV